MAGELTNGVCVFVPYDGAVIERAIDNVGDCRIGQAPCILLGVTHHHTRVTPQICNCIMTCYIVYILVIIKARLTGTHLFHGQNSTQLL
jgi:hypothetical protein